MKKLTIKTSTLSLDPEHIATATEWDDFVGLWHNAQEADRQCQWFRADIANQIEIKYGEKSLEQFAKEVGEARSTIENYRRVARAFSIDKEERGYNIPFSSFLIASYSDEYDKKQSEFRSQNRLEWVKRAETSQWSVRRLAQEIKNVGALKDGSSEFDLCVDYIAKFENTLLHNKKLNKKDWDKIIKKLELLVTQLKTKRA